MGDLSVTLLPTGCPAADSKPPPFEIASADAAPPATCTFLRRVLAVLISAFAIISITLTFIGWLLFDPRLLEVCVDSLLVSNFTLSSNSLSANRGFRFTVLNPNKKMNVSYDDNIQASTLYDSKCLAETTVSPFFQDTMTETACTATFVATGAWVENWAVDGINLERPNVKFDVVLMARFRFEAGSLETTTMFMTVYCGDLKVDLSQNDSSRNAVGGPRRCEVQLE